MKLKFPSFFVPLVLLSGLAFLTFPAPLTAENANSQAQTSPGSADAVTFDLASEDWKLSSGAGRRLAAGSEGLEGVKGAVLELTGAGKDSNAWELSNVPVLPDRTGMLRFKVRRTAGSGGGMTGFSFANYDISVTSEWQDVSLIFSIPKNLDSAKIRLGQWQISGTLQFAELQFLYLTPTFAENGLGADETVSLEPTGPVYHFASHWGGPQGNFSRTFVESSVWFNSNRWCFGGDGTLLFRFNASDFRIPGSDAAPKTNRFFGGNLKFTVGYHTHGSLTAQYSADGENWNDLATLSEASSQTVKLPLAPEGVERVWVRFKASKEAGLQLYDFQLDAPLTPPQKDAASASTENVPIGTQSAGMSGTTSFWELVSGDEGFASALPVDAELPKNQPGNQVFEKQLSWNAADGTAKSARVRCRYYVADFYREDFGQKLVGNGSDSSKDLTLWGCEATWKVSQQRSVPKESTSDGLLIRAARNDYESCQLVLRPKTALTLEKVEAAPLAKADGTQIPAENLTFRSVYYHFVDHPTDRTGVREAYPDALPPLTLPQSLGADQNAPLWLTAYVPEGTPAGDYATTVKLTFRTSDAAAQQTLTVPLKLHVWDFAIPAQNHSETAYGFSTGTAARYHGVKGEANRRKLNDIYYRFLGQYRISPYHPVENDDFSIRFIVDSEHPEKSHAVLDFSRFDEAMAHAIETYHFTNFSVYLPGMGGGTYHSRNEPMINGFGEETVEYQAMFASMVQQIEAHLREKGWLNMAYVYWFDEPDVKDYEFVKKGMDRIKKYAPGIQTMLTEEPAEDVIAKDLLGKVDVWCPVTPNFNEELAEKCRAKGERFWWYVCCWPHDPYCTEFIDHSAVEMRTWLWQSWKYDVVGTLIWTSNYWTSNTAFPDAPQNPYLDPMSYVSGYDTPAGTKRYWGNGDGRLYYPPLSCAVPNPNSDEPNFEQPVASIRLEMLREGLEDYEMLYLLRERLAAAKGLTPAERAGLEALLVVPEEITSSMTEFSTDPTPIYAQRKKVAEAIEWLRGR